MRNNGGYVFFILGLAFIFVLFVQTGASWVLIIMYMAMSFFQNRGQIWRTPGNSPDFKSFYKKQFQRAPYIIKNRWTEEEFIQKNGRFIRAAFIVLSLALLLFESLTLPGIIGKIQYISDLREPWESILSVLVYLALYLEFVLMFLPGIMYNISEFELIEEKINQKK